jgi:hypothetical protein
MAKRAGQITRVIEGDEFFTVSYSEKGPHALGFSFMVAKGLTPDPKLVRNATGSNITVETDPASNEVVLAHIGGALILER